MEKHSLRANLDQKLFQTFGLTVASSPSKLAIVKLLKGLSDDLDLISQALAIKSENPIFQNLTTKNLFSTSLPWTRYQYPASIGGTVKFLSA